VIAASEAPLAQLNAVLERLDRILGRAVERTANSLSPGAAADPFRGLYITDQDANRLLSWSRSSPLLGVAGDEPPLSRLLHPESLLATLARTHGLSNFDLEVVVIALVTEIDLAYGRLFAFLQDDVSRRRPSVDLALNLLCPTAEAKLARRQHFASDAPLLQRDLIELVPDLCCFFYRQSLIV